MKLIAALVAAASIAAPALAATPLVTVHADREPLSDFVRDVSRQANVKVVVAKDVSRERISARMTKVTVGDVIDVLESYKGLAAFRTSDGYFLRRRRTAGPVRVTQAGSVVPRS